MSVLYERFNEDLPWHIIIIYQSNVSQNKGRTVYQNHRATQSFKSRTSSLLGSKEQLVKITFEFLVKTYKDNLYITSTNYELDVSLVLQGRTSIDGYKSGVVSCVHL